MLRGWSKRRATAMADGQQDAGMTIGEEIPCLLAAGWRWEKDTLVHPRHRNIWIMYKRVDSCELGEKRALFEAHLQDAVRKVREDEREMRKKLRAAKAVIAELLKQKRQDEAGGLGKATNG
jgi:hypothetical protein